MDNCGVYSFSNCYFIFTFFFLKRCVTGPLPCECVQMSVNRNKYLVYKSLTKVTIPCVKQLKAKPDTCYDMLFSALFTAATASGNIQYSSFETRKWNFTILNKRSWKNVYLVTGSFQFPTSYVHELRLNDISKELAINPLLFNLRNPPDSFYFV